MSNTGRVTGQGVGTATITVRTNDGGFTATCSVTVTSAVLTISYKGNGNTDGAAPASHTITTPVMALTGIIFVVIVGLCKRKAFDLRNRRREYAGHAHTTQAGIDGRIFQVWLVVMFGQRFYHNYQRKIGSVNTFAIQNVKTGMDIRPYNAGVPDETAVIQFDHNNWECMTWQFIKLEDESYLLKNLYTQKTFQPRTEPEECVTLWQQPLEANSHQYWEFLKQEGETYLIRLKGTELYITALSEENNAELVLMSLTDTDSQLWRLISQQPIM